MKGEKKIMKQNNNDFNGLDDTRRRKKKRYIILIASIALVLPILIGYIYYAVYFKDHFYNKTIINGIDATKMTASEIEDVINAEVQSYRLSLEGRNGVTDSIAGMDINLHTEYAQSISAIVKKQKSYQWPYQIFKDHIINVETMIKYDNSLLEDKYKKLEFFKKEHVIEPLDATISEYGEDGYKIIPETPGAKIKDDVLYEAIQNAIMTLDASILLEETGCYEDVKIKSDHTKLRKALKKMNKLASAKITYEFGEKKEILDGKLLSNWISMDDNYKVHFDESGIKEFVDYIGKTYNTFGKVRTFKTSYGKVIKVKGGDYGWWLNRPKEVEELLKLVKSGEKLTREPVYYQTAQQFGENDIGDTYVEINLTNQRLFFYKNGKRIIDTDIVTGNVSKYHGTPTGTYPIQYKQRDATLVGEDYETPVKYWMPFNKNIGLHDANWRKKFGGVIYLTNGSHGCINMPPAAAKKLFDNVNRGVAVIVYKLSGT
jgi:hypothetical protein